MRTLWAWLVAKFWWLWGANLLAAFLVVFVFILGWVHETITAPNIPAWCVILSVVPALLVGSLWLRSAGHADLATLIVLAIPLSAAVWVAGSLLFGVLYLVIALVAHLLGHGRTN
ncbi:MAG: hypothetical protein ABI992_09165 [Chthoniobacterales bacterium]